MKSRNFTTSLLPVQAGAVINTEFSVAHKMSTIPLDAFVVGGNLSAILYKGSTAWTTTTAYLKADTANASFLVLFFT